MRFIELPPETGTDEKLAPLDLKSANLRLVPLALENSVVDWVHGDREGRETSASASASVSTSVSASVSSESVSIVRSMILMPSTSSEVRSMTSLRAPGSDDVSSSDSEDGDGTAGKASRRIEMPTLHI